MKKALLIFCTAILAAALCIGFAACEDDASSENEHSTVYHAAVAATCTEGGNIAYYSCSHCDKLFEDEAATKEITGGVTIPALGHDLSVLQHDETQHWYKCSRCEEIGEETAHSGGTATCTAKAKCEVCGQEYGELGAHNYVEEVAEKYLVSVATCTQPAVYYKSCSVCGEAGAETFTSGSALGHDLSVLQKDETYHWYKCSRCEEIGEKTAHSGGTATCTAKAQCEVCGQEYGELDAGNHVGGTEIRNATEATCTAKGYTGDTYCLGCGELIASGTEIEALGHDLSVLQKDETYHWYKCSRCEEIGEETAHTFAPATKEAPETCTVCSATQGTKLFYADSAAEFSVKNGNPNGNWTYGSVVYAWDNSQTIKKSDGTESFAFTASTAHNTDTWLAAGMEIKAGWLNTAGGTPAIAYKFGQAGTYSFAMHLNGSDDGTRISVRYVLIGANGSAKVWEFDAQGKSMKEWRINKDLTVEQGDTLYVMFFKEEGTSTYADYQITFTEKREQAQ